MKATEQDMIGVGRKISEALTDWSGAETQVDVDSNPNHLNLSVRRGEWAALVKITRETIEDLENDAGRVLWLSMKGLFSELRLKPCGVDEQPELMATLDGSVWTRGAGWPGPTIRLITHG